MIRFATFTLFAIVACDAAAAAQTPASAASCVATDALNRAQRPADGTLLIQQICSGTKRIDGATIGVAAGNAAAVQMAVKAGQTFAGPTTFTTPAGVSLDVISANGNQQRIAPSTNVFQNVGKLGEFFSVAAGHVTAFVVNRLSFYNIQSLKVVAASRGTIFDVDAQPDAVTFSISEGKLELSRLVAIQFKAENRTIEGVRVTDTITPTGTSKERYAVPFPIFKVFANAAEATAFFAEQLSAAQASGSESQIENSLENLDRVHNVVTPTAGNAPSAHVVHVAPVHAAVVASSSLSAPVVAVAGLAMAAVASGVATDGFSSPKVATKTVVTPPAGNQGGSITLQSHARRRYFSFSIPFRI